MAGSAGNTATNPIFNRLCHLVVLNKDEEVTRSLDRLLLSLLVVDEDLRASSWTDVRDALQAYFNLSPSPEALVAAIDRALEKGYLVVDEAKRFRLIPKVKAELEQRIADAASLEEDVRTEWLEGLASESLTRAVEQELWNCLRQYMSLAFLRHGAETSLLLNPANEVPSGLATSLTHLLDKALANCRHNTSTEFLEQAIRFFFETSTPKRSSYLAQLLDGTFTLFALSSDEQTAAYLKERLPPLAIFLDTNFIFGILDLHANPLVDVSQELLEVIRENRFPFKLYYHEKTLEELKVTLAAIGERLKGHRWQPSVSRAAIRSRSLSSLERKFHEKNAEVPVDPEVFLSKYEHPEALLADMGATIYREPSTPRADSETWEKGKLIAEYAAFLNQRGRDKPYAAQDHDMVVWRAVQRHRGKGTSLLDAGAFLLTVDYHFYTFDWRRLRKRSSIGSLILPNQFLQILRPFVAPSEDFDQRFVETFSIPEVRAVAVSREKTTSRILSYLNTYSDIKEETAVRILANKLLVDELADVDAKSAEFEKKIESALVRENEQLLEEREAFRAEAEVSRKAAADERQRVAAEAAKAEEARKELEATRRALEEREKAVAEERARINAERARERSSLETNLRDQQKDLRALQLQRDDLERRAARTRIAFWVVVGIIGGAFILLLPVITNWRWLLDHDAMFGIYGCALLIWIGAIWMIVDPKRRKGQVTALVIGALLVLLQILGGDSGTSSGASPTPTL